MDGAHVCACVYSGGKTCMTIGMWLQYEVDERLLTVILCTFLSLVSMPADLLGVLPVQYGQQEGEGTTAVQAGPSTRTEGAVSSSCCCCGCCCYCAMFAAGAHAYHMHDAGSGMLPLLSCGCVCSGYSRMCVCSTVCTIARAAVHPTALRAAAGLTGPVSV
jgi:hypothetical protein